MPKRLLSLRLFIFTLVVVICNYSAFYLDDLFIYYGWTETSLMVYSWRTMAFPVTWYVQVIEPYTLLSIPVLGRALNYCVELVYFYSLVWLFNQLVCLLDCYLVKPMQHYFGDHA